MTLQELQHSFQLDAAALGDYQLLTKTELANGYCECEELVDAFRQEGNNQEANRYEYLRSSYFSALILRYWYKIFEWIQNSSSLRLEPIEFVNWLNESINDALYYRSWRKIRHDHKAEKANNHTKIVWMENPQYVDDPDAADKSINYFIKAKRGKEYQYYNKDKRKTNVIKYSLDNMVDEEGDYAVSYAGAYVEPELENKVDVLISEFIKRGEYLEALIINGIAYHDTYTQQKVSHTETHLDEETGEEYEEEFTNYKSSFNSRKLVKHLNLINQEFVSDFCKTYSIEEAFAESTFTKLKSLSNTKLYKLIEKTIIEVRKTLLECLQ